MAERRRFQLIPKDGQDAYQVLLDGVDVAHSVRDISINWSAYGPEVTLMLTYGKTELDLPDALVTVKPS